MNINDVQKNLFYYSDIGDIERVKELINQGADVNCFDEDLSFTALHYAVKGEHLELVKYLITIGANVNANEESRIGETPLGEVAANCSLEMAKLLIAAGADPTIKGWMQLTALNRASNRKKAEGKKVYQLLYANSKK